ncbi:hypothetical protein HYPSUDRAFT_48374, partial [Hypholoma sublateritium FD-334 SS-4]
MEEVTGTGVSIPPGRTNPALRGKQMTLTVPVGSDAGAVAVTVTGKALLAKDVLNDTLEEIPELNDVNEEMAKEKLSGAELESAALVGTVTVPKGALEEMAGEKLLGAELESAALVGIVTVPKGALEEMAEEKLSGAVLESAALVGNDALKDALEEIAKEKLVGSELTTVAVGKNDPVTEEALAGKGNPSCSGKQMTSSSPIDVPVAEAAEVVALVIVTTTLDVAVAGSETDVAKDTDTDELAEPNTSLPRIGGTAPTPTLKAAATKAYKEIIAISERQMLGIFL